jgi:hypothetical protein
VSYHRRAARVLTGSAGRLHLNARVVLTSREEAAGSRAARRHASPEPKPIAESGPTARRTEDAAYAALRACTSSHGACSALGSGQGRSGGRAGPNDPDRHSHPQLVGRRDYDCPRMRRSRGWRRSYASLLAARGSDPESALRRSCVGLCWCASELVGWLGRWARLTLVRARWLRIKLLLGKCLFGCGLTADIPTGSCLAPIR